MSVIDVDETVDVARSYTRCQDDNCCTEGV